MLSPIISAVTFFSEWFSVIITSAIIYAFGEIVDKLCDIERNTRLLSEKLADSETNHEREERESAQKEQEITIKAAELAKQEEAEHEKAAKELLDKEKQKLEQREADYATELSNDSKCYVKPTYIKKYNNSEIIKCNNCGFEMLSSNRTVCWKCGVSFVPYRCGKCGHPGPYEEDCPECNSSIKIHYPPRQ